MRGTMENVTWEYILDSFIKDFEKHKYQKDQKMPTENETAVKFGVNRNEVRLVYKKLKDLGYIYSVQGRGSFFCGKRIKIPLSMVKGGSFSKKMKELGIPYRTENVEARVIHYNSNIYEELQAAEDEVVWKITLLRFLYDEPVAIHTRYMREKFFPNLSQDAQTILSSREYLHSNGFSEVDGAEGQMAILPISHKKRTLLNMRNKQEAMVLTGKTIHLIDDCILELYCTTYRDDRFIFLLS
ncbi:GntR family transcriptional regulator [Anaerosporobacter sp.]|uniref:GntR family transcriptional regulator n=1 Tax=Anaerosporobacter sp. TaxID=1872529 RepID=UPI00286F92DF|nr:GntR family transcriptional regulator [Anaerosporobacter sp.]